MSKRLADALAQLEDPRFFVVRRAIPVFDEHAEYDEDGKLIRDFTRQDLEKIASNSNRRDSTGTLCPLTLGHTTDDPEESHQPEPVGYARHFRVKYVPDLQRYAILADYYVRKGDYEKAQTYPRSSVELWPQDDIFDPIALLRRTPDRDLGQWTYSKHGKALRYARRDRQGRIRQVLRYSMERTPMADESAVMSPEEGQSNDMQQFFKHMAKHPGFRQAMRYAADEAEANEGGMEDEGMEGSEGLQPSEATEPEAYAADDLFDSDHDEDDPTEMPEQHAAEMALPSGSNGFIPGEEEAPEKKRKYSREEKARMAADSRRVKTRRTEDRVAALEAQVQRYQRAARQAQAERRVTQLEAEGYVLDRAEEVAELMARPAKSWDDYEQKVRRCYQKAPVVTGGPGLIPVQPGRNDSIEPDENGLVSAKRAEQVLRYQKKNGWMDYKQALKECPANY